MDTLKAEIKLKSDTNRNTEQEGQPTKKKYMWKGDLAKLEADQELEEKKKKNKAAKMASNKSIRKKLEVTKENKLATTLKKIRYTDNLSDYLESDKEHRLRLRAIQPIEERTKGGRNELIQALECVKGKMDLEALPKQANDSKINTKSSGTNSGNDCWDGSDNDSDNDLATNQDTKATVDLNLIKTDPRKIYPQIYFALKRVLKEWEQSMAEQSDHVRLTIIQITTRVLTPDVLQAVAEIVHHMQTQEYIRANNTYLRLSIGNAPWPIGLTMVGIHEWSGHEKILSNNVVHVLNDEFVAISGPLINPLLEIIEILFNFARNMFET
ncbi:hypothetical protein MJO28_017437 [Puccinia striiformis f. sp. tritici]|nr:hypothetical protein MJO28_017437 [Puccinia striiformis f. sp. tritici]